MVTALGALLVTSLTHADESGIQTFGPLPAASEAAVTGAASAVTAYVAQAPDAWARPAAVLTALTSGPATETWIVVGALHEAPVGN